MEDAVTKRLIWLALLIGALAAVSGWAEDMSGHLESHQMVSHLHGDPVATPVDGETHAVTAVYDLYCQDCGRVIQEAYFTLETQENHAMITVTQEPDCVTDGLTYAYCSVCGYETEKTVLPATGRHPFEEHPAKAPVCGESDGWAAYSVCPDCGLIVDADGVPLDGIPVIPAAAAHEYEVLLCVEPTCTEEGRMVRVCALCGREEIIRTPALGHTCVWTAVAEPTPESSGISEYVCVLCGYVADRVEVPYQEMMYDNTVTSFGPSLRELIGGSDWQRVTPIDLTKDGVFTFPLIASNRFTVGTVSVVQADGWQVITYQLNNGQFTVRSEALAIYADLDALRRNQPTVRASFDEPIDLRACFGDDQRVILSVSLKMDYDVRGKGVEAFTENPAQISAMMALID